MEPAVDVLAQAYGAWWIDFLGEHNHVGGEAATRWLLDRSGVGGSGPLLDAGAFVGAAPRLAARLFGVRAVAADVNEEFLAAGRRLAGGASVDWVAAANHRLPFATGSFASVWCLDSEIVPRELSRVAAERATLCLSCETPDDGRGGAEAFVEEWSEYGWHLRAHKPTTMEAVQAWREAESAMVARRSFYEPRYGGQRYYLGQLDQAAELVRSYSMHERGHGLFVFARGDG
jgi:SAM-dependent methyltransferase